MHESADANREHAPQRYSLFSQRKREREHNPSLHALTPMKPRSKWQSAPWVSDASALCRSFDYWINASPCFCSVHASGAQRARWCGLAAKMHFYRERSLYTTLWFCTCSEPHSCFHLFTARRYTLLACTWGCETNGQLAERALSVRGILYTSEKMSTFRNYSERIFVSFVERRMQNR
jgi:hypothetical protein